MEHASTAAVPRGSSEATMMKQAWLEAVLQHAWTQQLWYTQAVLRTFLRKNSHIVHLHLPTLLLHRGPLRIALQFSQVVRHRDCVCRDQGNQRSVPQGWTMKILWTQLWWGWFEFYFGHCFGMLWCYITLFLNCMKAWEEVTFSTYISALSKFFWGGHETWNLKAS